MLLIHRPNPKEITMKQTQSRSTQAMQLPEHLRTRCEVWTRVMGYHRPVSSFNIGKQGEFRERRFFDEPR